MLHLYLWRNSSERTSGEETRGCPRSNVAWHWMALALPGTRQTGSLAGEKHLISPASDNLIRQCLECMWMSSGLQFSCHQTKITKTFQPAPPRCLSCFTSMVEVLSLAGRHLGPSSHPDGIWLMTRYDYDGEMRKRSFSQTKWEITWLSETGPPV